MENNNENKYQVIQQIIVLESKIENKLRILRALDEDEWDSGAYDLHDQLFQIESTFSKLQDQTFRANKVIPRT